MKTTIQTNHLPFDEQHEMDFINGKDLSNVDTDATVEKDIYDAYNF